MRTRLVRLFNLFISLFRFLWKRDSTETTPLKGLSATDEFSKYTFKMVEEIKSFLNQQETNERQTLEEFSAAFQPYTFPFIWLVILALEEIRQREALTRFSRSIATKLILSLFGEYEMALKLQEAPLSVATTETTPTYTTPSSGNFAAA